MSRGRSGPYPDGMRAGAPAAVQVADGRICSRIVQTPSASPRSAPASAAPGSPRLYRLKGMRPDASAAPAAGDRKNSPYAVLTPATSRHKQSSCSVPIPGASWRAMPSTDPLSRIPWIGRAPAAPYFIDETGAPWTPIGQNDALTWPELAGSVPPPRPARGRAAPALAQGARGHLPAPDAGVLSPRAPVPRAPGRPLRPGHGPALGRPDRALREGGPARPARLPSTPSSSGGAGSTTRTTGPTAGPAPREPSS